MANIRVRIAAVSDLPEIQDIGCETYREHFSSIWSEGALEEFLCQEFSEDSLQRSLSSPHHTWLAAEDASQALVGYAKINWERPDPITHTTGTELQKIYFRAHTTGKGYGRKLMAVVADMAAERSNLLWLDVLKSNVAAQHFYASCGFSSLGEIPFSTDLQKIGMVVMCRRLTANNSFKPTPLRGAA